MEFIVALVLNKNDTIVIKKLNVNTNGRCFIVHKTILNYTYYTYYVDTSKSSNNINVLQN